MEKSSNFLLTKKEKDQLLNKTDVVNEPISQKVTETISDLLISLANEPSLAYFHIQEHIRKSTPEILKHQTKVEHLDSQLRGSCYDLDYALDNIKSITKASIHFNRINELLKSSLFAKLQLDYARMNALTRKKPQGQRPAQCNQDIPTDSSYSNNECTEIPANSRTLSQISSTVSTAAVQVRDQAINLTKRVLWTQSADVSYSTTSPSE
ncbi:unnamed protein product [Schistosoma turkestanicum]|nr:unnamed protein product [Schistosoma turkestanicum]